MQREGVFVSFVYYFPFTKSVISLGETVYMICWARSAESKSQTTDGKKKQGTSLAGNRTPVTRDSVVELTSGHTNLYTTKELLMRCSRRQ